MYTHCKVTKQNFENSFKSSGVDLGVVYSLDPNF